MKKTVIGLILIIFLTQAYALQDAYVNIDPKGFDFCVAADNLSYYTCNQTYSVAFDGTRDASLYLITKPSLTPQSSALDVIRYISLTPLNLFLGLGILLLLLFLGVAFIVVILHLLTGALKVRFQ